MNVLFMGTPHFAVKSLEALVEANHDVVGVVTRPDKPVGRGRTPVAPPVKEAAERFGLRVFQPRRVNAPEAVEMLRETRPDLVVVTAFGAILKQPLLELVPRGAVNVHASLLPDYRGAAPVQWALIHGVQETGVTTMLMDAGLDTGPMLKKRTLAVDPGETAGELLERLGETGGKLLAETLAELEAGTLIPKAQPEAGTYAPRLERAHGHLDFTRSNRDVLNQFRGTTPAPGARVFLGGDAVLVTGLRLAPEGSGEPYAILETGKRHLRVAAGDGALDLLEVRPPGKKTMDAASFARGRRLSPGDRLSPPQETPNLELMQAVP